MPPVRSSSRSAGLFRAALTRIGTATSFGFASNDATNHTLLRLWTSRREFAKGDREMGDR